MQTKFDRLLKGRRVSNLTDDRQVVNMSSKTLSTPQKSILGKGLNFGPAPKWIPVPQLVVTVEQDLKSVPPLPAEKVRHRVMGILRSARPPASNITPEECIALKELKNDEDVFILPADKGRATVLPDRSEYDEKMTTLLSDITTYKVLESDPTPSLQRKLNKWILGNGTTCLLVHRLESGVLPVQFL